MNAPRHFDQDPAATVADALNHLPPDCDRETWVLLGMAAKDALGDGGFDVWDRWSQGADSYRAQDALSAWRSFKPGKVTAGTLFHLARQAGWKPEGGAVQAPPRPAPDPAREAARRAAEQAAHDAAARKARAIWQRARPAQAHPYLARKAVRGHGARLAFGKLVIPLFSGALSLDGALCADLSQLTNLQLIDADGGKRFLRGGRKAGCFWWIGPPSRVVCIAEGFATAASVLEATGNRCFVAFDAGNLPAAALAVRGLLPDSEIVLCADHDASGKGWHYANLAAQQAGGTVAMPDTPGEDFNDVWRAVRGGAARRIGEAGHG